MRLLFSLPTMLVLGCGGASDGVPPPDAAPACVAQPPASCDPATDTTFKACPAGDQVLGVEYACIAPEGVWEVCRQPRSDARAWCPSQEPSGGLPCCVRPGAGPPDTCTYGGVKVYRCVDQHWALIQTGG